MGHKSLNDCIKDLDQAGQLLRIPFEVDPNLEMAEIHRRIFDAKGPAILFEKVKGSPFRAVSNIYGTYERTEYLFRDTIKMVQKVTQLKINPMLLLKKPGKYMPAAFTALRGLPRKVRGRTPVEYGTTTIDKIPQVKSWPMDGGAFVTCPQVFTMAPNNKNIMESNLGMYRVQLSGNDYIQNEEIGMHYQLHRGIGVHHTAYNKSQEPFRASVFIGGPPAHTFGAIMPMPEGLTELTFAGMLTNRRFRYKFKNEHVLSADADFVITGTILKEKKKKEGPFGDHLGYYSLEHDFPVMKVDKVYHKKDAIWQFTVVGRPPQEDSSFGHLIHLLVTHLTGQEFPGLKNINAVDAAGVHPLLLAVGSERYMPFREKKPEEILIQANRILGSGQTSLAKFLIIADDADAPGLDSSDIPNFFQHVLERIDWKRDLHFQTNTTIDTLDYSGSGWNEGSKVIMACCGKPLRKLGREKPTGLTLPTSYNEVHMALPGILAISGKPFTSKAFAEKEMKELSNILATQNLENFPLIVVTDDASFTAATLNNFLWEAFTRCNPSHDIYGVNEFIENKHWGCNNSLILDSRIKPHHAPVLIEDPKITAKVDEYFKRGGLLEKYS